MTDIRPKDLSSVSSHTTGDRVIIDGATSRSITVENLIDSMSAATETTPTPTSGTGTITSATASLKYIKHGKHVRFTATVVITTNGTGASYVKIPLPFTAEARDVCCVGFDVTAILALVGYIPPSLAEVRIFKADGTYPGATGKTLMVSGQYWSV